MTLIKGQKYRVWWIDAAGDAGWQDNTTLSKLIKEYEKGVEQELFFIKESKLFYIFTSGKHLGDGNYTDAHLIPKAWAKVERIK